MTGAIYLEPRQNDPAFATPRCDVVRRLSRHYRGVRSCGVRTGTYGFAFRTVENGGNLPKKRIQRIQEYLIVLPALLSGWVLPENRGKWAILRVDLGAPGSHAVP